MLWINLAQSFKKYAKANPMNPRELLAELSSAGAGNIFAGIVGPTIATEMWKKDSESLVVKYGIPIAQEISTLLEPTDGVTWDSVRTSVGKGENPKWLKWAEKYKANPEIVKVPENPFLEPELLSDPEIQKEAIRGLSDALRAKLESVRVVV